METEDKEKVKNTTKTNTKETPKEKSTPKSTPKVTDKKKKKDKAQTTINTNPKPKRKRIVNINPNTIYNSECLKDELLKAITNVHGSLDKYLENLVINSNKSHWIAKFIIDKIFYLSEIEINKLKNEDDAKKIINLETNNKILIGFDDMTPEIGIETNHM